MPNAAGYRQGWGLRKPPLGTMVDFRHPLARDLRINYLFNEGGGFRDTSGSPRNAVYDACRGIKGTLTQYGNASGSGNDLGKYFAPGRFNATTFAGRYTAAGGGSTSHINLDNNSIYKPSAQLTLSCWVYPFGNITSYNACSFLDYRNNGTWTPPYVAYLLGYAQGASRKPTFAVTTSGTLTGADSANTIAATTWTHLAGTYDGVTLTLYVNGKVDTTNTKSGSIDYGNNGPLCIGDISTQPNRPNPVQPLDGLMEDFRVYGRALRQFEIQWAMREPFAHLLQQPPSIVISSGLTGTVVMRRTLPQKGTRVGMRQPHDWGGN